jgi:hypothetical protein
LGCRSGSTLIEPAYWGGITQIDQYRNINHSCQLLSWSHGFANWLRRAGCDCRLNVSSVEEDIKGDHQYTENASGNERTPGPRRSTNSLRRNQFRSCMCEMSHIRVEAWRTGRQMIAYRFVTFGRPICQQPERAIRRAALTLGIRKSLREIGAGKLKEIPFSLKGLTIFGVGYHSKTVAAALPAYFRPSLLLTF